jgi:hypothetical protein
VKSNHHREIEEAVSTIDDGGGDVIQRPRAPTARFAPEGLV